MHIKMLGTHMGVVDGHSLIKRFKKGRMYDTNGEGEKYIPGWQANYFVTLGLAVVEHPDPANRVKWNLKHES